MGKVQDLFFSNFGIVDKILVLGERLGTKL